MRKLTANQIASYGTILIIFPFIITMILTAVGYNIGVEDSQFVLYRPENFENMTVHERKLWFNASHGGDPTVEWRWELSLTWPLIGSNYYIFPDGLVLDDDTYIKYVDNDESTDWGQMVMQVFTVNPKLLQYIGIYGLIIRITLIVCVAIGFADIIWIG